MKKQLEYAVVKDRSENFDVVRMQEHFCPGKKVFVVRDLDDQQCFNVDADQIIFRSESSGAARVHARNLTAEDSANE